MTKEFVIIEEVLLMKKNTRRPTDAELTILQVLWDRGPSTVREVYKILAGDKSIGYTTVLKLMQIMTDKELEKTALAGRQILI